MNDDNYKYELVAITIIALGTIFAFAFLSYQIIKFCFL